MKLNVDLTCFSAFSRRSLFLVLLPVVTRRFPVDCFTEDFLFSALMYFVKKGLPFDFFVKLIHLHFLDFLCDADKDFSGRC